LKEGTGTNTLNTHNRESALDVFVHDRKPTEENEPSYAKTEWRELGGPNLKYETKPKEKAMRGNLNSKRRHFQALRDFIFFDEKPNILENYMELVV